MRRRDLLLLMAGAVLPSSEGARAQAPDRMRTIGVLCAGRADDPEAQNRLRIFLHRLHDLGWREGSNLHVEVRWGNNSLDSYRTFAKELVEKGVELIQVNTTPATGAVLGQTRSIPVVFTTVSDPIGSGFVETFSRPGHNATGFINIEASMGGKWVQLLKEIAPSVTRVAVLFNPKTAPQTAYYMAHIEATASSAGVRTHLSPAEDIKGIEEILISLGKDTAAGLIVTPDLFTVAKRTEITDLAAKYRVPSVYPFGLFVRDGGLVAYGVDLGDLHYRAAGYADRILRGARPEELPVQQPAKFELVVNLKAARSLGLDVKPTLLARADEVIE